MNKSLSLYKARGIIKKLNRMNLDQIGYGHIQDTIANLIIGLPVKMIKPSFETRLYRGVIHNHKPSNINLLGYPPKHLVCNFQRCNPPNYPMFYCSIDPAVVLSELRVQPGDKVYMSKWSIIKEFYCARISPNEDEEENSPENDLIFGYFETKFLQPVHETYSNQYKITSAISQKLTTGDVVDQLISLGGLTYPSVAHASRSDNIVIQPQIVDRCLRLDWVEELLVETASAAEISYTRTDFSSKFEAGLIGWTGKVLHWTLAPQQFVQMTAEHDGWVARDAQGNIVNPG